VRSVQSGFFDIRLRRRRFDNVLDLLLADLPELRIDGRVVSFGRPSMHYAARAEAFLESGVLGIAGILRFFFHIEVIGVPKELVEAMNRRQEFISIAGMVLAELHRRVANIPHELSDAGIVGDAVRRSAMAQIIAILREWET